MKLKQGCSIYSDYGLNISAEDYVDHGVPIIRTSDVDNSGKLDLSNTKYVEPNAVGTKRLQKGDLLFSRSGTIGRSMVFDDDVQATYAAYLVRFRPQPKRLMPKFIGYWAQSADYWHQIGADTIQSTIGNFNANKFANLSIPDHDLATQREIADFLDRETARIDLLIEKKQKLVKLLGEKWSTTITEAVTGARNRSSAEGGGGVTDIMMLASPPNWQLYRLGQLFRERKEKGSDKDFAPLSVTMRGIVPQLETAAKSDDGDNRKIVRVGDYVINSRSDRKGSGGISDHEGSVSLISIVLQTRSIDPRFAHHLLRSPAFQEEFYRWGHGIVADLWTTRYAEMKNIRLCVPDLSTQREIADFLDRETARIVAVKEKTLLSVDRLKEYRSALITAAVTGKIDVTTYAKSGATDRRLDAIEEEMGA